MRKDLFRTNHGRGVIRFYLGFALVVIGIGCWSVPAAMIFAGALLVLNASFA